MTAEPSLIEAALIEAVLIEAAGLEVRIAGRRVLYDIDISVAPGEIVTVMGPNGAGKTTLLRVLLGLVNPSAGTLRRRDGMRLAYMPQNLEIDRTLPLSVRRFLAMAGPVGSAAIEAAAAETGITRVLDHPIQDVSGGEAKRASLARALLREPDLLVLDEPSASLDVHGQKEVYDLIQTIRDRRGCGVLLVSHDLHLVMAATDRVICLNGHVCCSGRPEAVGRHPEFLALFGERGAEAFGVYAHMHDHVHDDVHGHDHVHDDVHGHDHVHDHVHDEPHDESHEGADPR